MKLGTAQGQVDAGIVRAVVVVVVVIVLVAIVVVVVVVDVDVVRAVVVVVEVDFLQAVSAQQRTRASCVVALHTGAEVFESKCV